jgi:hypothetical protein
MSRGDLVTIAVIVLAFSTFGAVLAWAELRTRGM